MEVAKSNKEATKHSEKTSSEVKKMIVPSLTFEVKPLHKKALLKLLHCHHNGIFPTYQELSREMEVGEKTKAWQCEAWKHLKTNNFIVPGSEKKTFCLSEEGMVLASSFASDAELAEFLTPSSNEELHEKIRTKLLRDVDKGRRKHKGKEIFDLLLEDNNNRASWTRLELASKLGTNPDAHAFFYGFNALKKMGLVEMVGNVTREELKRKAESFLTKKSNDNDDKPKKKPKKNPIPDSDDKSGGDGLVKEEETCIVKTELEEKKDKTPRKNRIRGGTQLFSLLKKAFLVTAQKQDEAN